VIDTTTATAAISASPYKGLEYFAEEDARFFFGREVESEIVIANVLASRLTLLYGESGVGKSSLLHAGVLPLLRSSRDLEPLLVSTWRDDPVATVARAARELAGLEQPERELPLVETLAACADRLDRDLLVILDQFEENFVYRPDEDGPGTFAVEFPRAVARRELPVTFLVSVREDALAKLDRFKGRIPNLFDTYLRVERLDREGARTAIERPLEAWNREVSEDHRVAIEQELVETLLDEVSTGRVQLARGGAGGVDGSSPGRARIETPYLQLVLSRLWQEEAREGSRLLRLETLRRLGGADRIVQTHLDGALDGLSPAQQDLAAAVFRYLVTPSGSKIAHQVDDLADYAGLAAGEIEPMLARLAAGDLRILRPVAESTYEIYHDVLAAAILDWRARFIAAREQQALEDKRRRRRRITLAVTAPVIAAAIAVPLTLWRVQTHRASDARRQALLAAASSARYFHGVMIGHRDRVNRAVFSRDGKFVATASDDGTARVWRGTDGTPLATLKIGRRVFDLSFGRSDSVLATAGDDGRVRVWNWRQRRLLGELTGSGSAFNRVAFNRAGTMILAASDDETARLWDWPSRRPVAVLDGEHGSMHVAQFNRQGTLVVTASSDDRARIWDLTARRVIASFTVGRNPDTDIVDAEFSPDGHLLVTASDDGRTIIWDWAAERMLAVLPGHEYWLGSAAFNPDGTLVVTAGGLDNVVSEVWPWRATRRPAIAFQGHTDSVESAVFSPDGRLVVTASADGTARLWQPPSGHSDLVVRNVTARAAGRAVLVECAVANIGGSAAQPTTVRANAVGLAGASKPVRRLAVGATAHLEFRLALQTRKHGAVLVRVAVDPGRLVPELNKVNNVATVRVSVPSA
jgi:hypothetical protein